MKHNRKSILRIGKDTVVYDGHYMQAVRREFFNTRTRKSGVWEMVRRKTHGCIVAIAALTPDRRIVLTRIYRVPQKSWIIEAPAGLADRKGESEENLARRELLEETGYAVRRMRELTHGVINAGITDDRMVYFLGIGAQKVQEPQLEDGEDMDVFTVPLNRLEWLLKHPPDGARIDLKLFGLPLLLKRYL